MGHPTAKETIAEPGLAALAGVCAVVMVGLALPFYAVSTYDGGVRVPVDRWFATPLLAIEFLVVVMCLLARWNPVASLREMPRPVRLGIAVWLAGATVSSIYAVRPDDSWLMQGIWLLHGTFAIALWSRLSGPWRSARPAWLISLTLGLLALSAVVYAVAAVYGGDDSLPWEAFSVAVANPRHYVFYGAPLLGLAVGWLALANTRRQMTLALVCLFLAYHLLAWSGGRNALGVAIMFPAFFVLLHRPGWKRVLPACLACATLAYPATLLTAPDRPIYGFGSSSDRLADNSYGSGVNAAGYSSGRGILWEAGFEMIRERPVAGHGQFQFDLVLDRVPDRNMLPLIRHPHNAAIQFVFDWGIFATAGLVIMLVPFALSMPRRLRTEPGVAVPAFGGLFALAMTSAFDGTYFFTAPLFITAILLAALATVKLQAVRRSDSIDA
ncbi:O-antigen ligase family protein [Parerythrobacter aurantius]|uniref:O-antigen ligase family protein n=1 Tax=Parerythrobacter aurantius TaxID=3127706 RepID=UPI0032552F9D